jgi:hypothetical protein
MKSLTAFWPLRLAVRTPPFHGGDTGSIPVEVTTLNYELVLKESLKVYSFGVFCSERLR